MNIAFGVGQKRLTTVTMPSNYTRRDGGRQIVAKGTQFKDFLWYLVIAAVAFPLVPLFDHLGRPDCVLLGPGHPVRNTMQARNANVSVNFMGFIFGSFLL
jgi:hypothetical protein